MTGTLTFNLPEEGEEFRISVEAGKWYNVALDIDQYLRDRLKYGHEAKTTADEALEDARAKLHDILSEHGLSLYG